MRVFGAVILAAFVCAGLIRIALASPRIRNKAVANPVSDRWHITPTPSFGGVPMFVAFVATTLVLGGLNDAVTRALLLGAAAVFVVGFVDDLKGVSPSLKLAGQIAGALAVMLTVSSDRSESVVAVGVAVLWIVLISNSVNLVDNMDGLAAGTATASLIVILPVVVGADQEGLSLVTGAVLGAVLGFLLFNRSPARVFMGDAGSLWLGLVIASIVALADYGDRRSAPLVAVTIMAVPLLDTATVVISRLRNGFSIMRGGSDHLSHRLAKRGLSDSQSVGVLTALAAVSGLVAIAEPVLSTPGWFALVGVTWAGLIACASALLRVAVYQE
jgi:UDP-GlcNAc:undecaprenyl-phosphate GlcNAc-1-phosphate transferase